MGQMPEYAGEESLYWKEQKLGRLDQISSIVAMLLILVVLLGIPGVLRGPWIYGPAAVLGLCLNVLRFICNARHGRRILAACNAAAAVAVAMGGVYILWP